MPVSVQLADTNKFVAITRISLVRLDESQERNAPISTFNGTTLNSEPGLGPTSGCLSGASGLSTSVLEL